MKDLLPAVSLYCLEADEMWSFVGAKDCPEWLWLAVDRRTGLVVDFHLGSRDEAGAWGLWLSLPEALREKALVFTDGLAAYEAIFAPGQHQVRRKKTNHQDRTPEQYPAATLRKVSAEKPGFFQNLGKPLAGYLVFPLPL
ncbi:IS1 family transposase [Rapidithrix thailandica]|uniref:IS1 family transposase n=1 Tax=Rapidithrix thailandica TaxID=413964 RepID=A0AAW9SBU7_9BACT